MLLRPSELLRLANSLEGFGRVHRVRADYKLKALRGTNGSPVAAHNRTAEPSVASKRKRQIMRRFVFNKQCYTMMNAMS